MAWPWDSTAPPVSGDCTTSGEVMGSLPIRCPNPAQLIARSKASEVLALEPVAALDGLRVDPHREVRVLMAELLHDVLGVIPRRGPEARVVRLSECGVTRSLIGSMPSSPSRMFAALIAALIR